jgi:hypothetical protein
MLICVVCGRPLSARYVTKEENVTHLITFADNNAVGYFQKQARAPAPPHT